MQVETYMSFSFLIVGFVVGWCLRELYLRQQDFKQLSLISLIASLYAANQTSALKQAPILRQYIERYLPGKDMTDAETQARMDEMAQEFEQMFSLGKGKSPKAKEVVKNGASPEDLV